MRMADCSNLAPARTIQFSCCNDPLLPFLLIDLFLSATCKFTKSHLMKEQYKNYCVICKITSKVLINVFSFFSFGTTHVLQIKKKHKLCFRFQPSAVSHTVSIIMKTQFVFFCICTAATKTKMLWANGKKIIINRNIAHAPNILLKDRDDCRAGNFEFWNLIWISRVRFQVRNMSEELLR